MHMSSTDGWPADVFWGSCPFHQERSLTPEMQQTGNHLYLGWDTFCSCWSRSYILDVFFFLACEYSFVCVDLLKCINGNVQGGCVLLYVFVVCLDFRAVEGCSLDGHCGKKRNQRFSYIISEIFTGFWLLDGAEDTSITLLEKIWEILFNLQKYI